MSGAYDDIIYLPHHVSASRIHLTMEERAAQFSPFAALNGYEDAVSETARLTDCKTEIDENARDELNLRLVDIAAHIGDCNRYSVTYFRPDGEKSGGAYMTATGEIRRVDSFTQIVTMRDGTSIPIGDISRIEDEI